MVFLVFGFQPSQGMNPLAQRRSCQANTLPSRYFQPSSPWVLLSKRVVDIHEVLSDILALIAVDSI